MTTIAVARPRARTNWLAPGGLLLLAAIPLLGGAIRLVTLATGAEITPANARFFASPLPVVLHIVGASLYLVLGAFQFVPAIRRRAPHWHRRVGRGLVGAGIVAALAALWMTQFYPLPATDGTLLYGFRLVFGSAMIASIVIGFVAIRRREIARHRAWMIRGYAIGLGAGTQSFLLLAAQLVAGNPSVDIRALLMGAGWALNLAVAEWLIRGRRVPIVPEPRRSRTAGAGGS